MLKRLFLAAAITVLASGQALAKPSPFPLDIAVAKPPQPVMAEGRVHLVYELRITNFSRQAIEVTGLDVLAEGSAAPLASYAGAALDKAVGPVGVGDADKPPRFMGPGRSLVIFLDVSLAPGAAAPASLRHRLSVAASGKTQRIADVIDGLQTPVIAGPAVVLHPPLRGSNWVAANGLTSDDHRRAYVPVDGKARIAQRFAIDWVQLGPDGRLFRGDGKTNTDFPGYGADILAAADGRVAEVKDGVPDNAGNNTDRAVPITLETLGGNYVLEDLGHGRYAFYAHLQPGSLKVKPGQAVKAGQVLAKLGNSGNSDAPHLHFHVVDAASPMAAEGVPYVFDAFTQLGVADDPAVIDANAAWTARPGAAPAVHRGELPANNAVVAFP